MGQIVCKVCSTPIGQGDFVACATCFTPVHRNCWEYTGKCPIFGCGGTRAEEPIESLSRALKKDAGDLTEVREDAGPVSPALNRPREISPEEAQERLVREMLVPALASFIGLFACAWAVLGQWPELLERIFLFLSGIFAMTMGALSRRMSVEMRTGKRQNPEEVPDRSRDKKSLGP